MKRRTFISALPCLLLPGCGMRAIDRVAAAEGFVEFAGKRLDFVDAFLDFSYEPLEWGCYSLRVRFSHVPFTPDQIQKIRRGDWVDLNHQSIPEGFGSNTLSPYVSLELGRWRYGELPMLHERHRYMLTCGHFTMGKHITQLPSDRITVTKLTTTPPISLEFNSEGNTPVRGMERKWKLFFRGECHDDHWPMLRQPRTEVVDAKAKMWFNHRLQPSGGSGRS